MPCDSQAQFQTQTGKERMRAALARLDAQLADGSAQAVIGAAGGIAFRGWRENPGITDLCAYRKLSAANSPALRRALARAEVTSGRKLDPRALAAGTHSHDGGHSWGHHEHGGARVVLLAVLTLFAGVLVAHPGHAAPAVHAHDLGGLAVLVAALACIALACYLDRTRC